jgi:hypothetical protein
MTLRPKQSGPFRGRSGRLAREEGAIRIKRLIFFDSESAKQQTTAGIGVAVTIFGIGGVSARPATVGRAKNSELSCCFSAVLQFRNNFRGSQSD